MSRDLETKLKISGDSSSAQAALRSTEEGLGRVEKQAKKTGDESAISGAKLATAFRAAASALVVSQFIQANKSLEQLQRAFEAVTGSAEAGAVAFQHAKDQAEKVGAPVSGVAQAYLDFTASVKGSALEGEAATTVFDAVTAAMAAMGSSSERTQNALLALSQMAAKGTISMEELRGQLGEALPQGLAAMARGLGLTTQELIDLVSAGKLTAEEGLPALGNALLDIGGSGGKADLFSQSWERMKNAVNEAFTTIGQGVIWQGLTSAVIWATDEVKALSNGIDTLVEKINRLRGGTVAANSELDDLAASAKRAVDEMVRAGVENIQSGESYARLSLDVQKTIDSLQKLSDHESVVNQAAQKSYDTRIKTALSLGDEAKARQLSAEAAQSQLDTDLKLVASLQSQIDAIDQLLAKYAAEKEATGKLSSERQKQVDEQEELRKKKEDQLRLAKAAVEADKAEAATAKTVAEAKADQGKSVESLGVAYRKAAEEVKRLEAEQRAGEAASGAIARTQEEMAQIRERLFTASANASLGDAAWAEKVRELQGEESRLGDELERLIDVQARGAAASQVLAKAKDLVTQRELEYRAALDESILQSDIRLQQMQREAEIIQQQLQAKLAQAAGAERVNLAQAETLRVQAAVQQAIGNETRAQELLAKAKKEEEDASRAVVAQKRLEAQAAEESAKAKRAELIELEKQLALTKEKANLDGQVTDTEKEQIQTAQAAVEVARAQSKELDATAKAARQYAEAVADGAQANLDLADAQQQAERSARINAESMVTQNAAITEAISLTSIVRQNYYSLSEAAGRFFDIQMAGVQSLEQWRDALSDRQFERVKKLYEEQAGGVERLTEALQSGTLSAEELNAELARAERLVQGVGLNFSLLDNTQLGGLKSAIEAAKGQLEQMQAQLNAMNEDAAYGLRSLQSEIASLQGDQVRVAALDHQERLLALQEKLNAAVALGNEEAINLFQQQIALEDQRYKLQLDQVAAQAGDNEAAKLRAQMEKEKVNAARDVAEATRRAEDAAQATNQAAQDSESGFKGIYEWVIGAEKASRDLSENLTALTKAPIKIPIQFTYGGNQDLLRALANALGLANRAVPGGLN